MKDKLQKLEEKIAKTKQELCSIGEMRPGSISEQYKDPSQKTGVYYQLNYTYKMKTRTEYVRHAALATIRRQTAEFNRFKKLVDLLIDLSIQYTQLKTQLETLPAKRGPKTLEENMVEEKEVTLNITLVDSDPKIWRSINVSDLTNLEQLHYIIQGSFGWENAHLHQFKINENTCYSNDTEGIKEGMYKDSRAILIKDLINKNIKKFEYEYDFGDDWIHEVEIKKISKEKNVGIKAECVDGAMACPPEDCGGIWGYQELLEILADKKHPEYKDRLDWLGVKFNPEKFSIKNANAGIKEFQKFIG